MLAGRWPTLVSALLIGIALATPRVMHAQRIAGGHVGVGTPLQVSTESDTNQTVRFLSQSARELEVQESCGSGCERVVRIPWAAVTRVDAAVPIHSLRRTMSGGAIGATYALALGYATSRFLPCRRNGARCPGFGAVLFIPGIVTVGGAVGAAVGWRPTRERWQQVWPD